MKREFRGQRPKIIMRINGDKRRAIIIKTREPRKVLLSGPWRDDEERALTALCACFEPNVKESI